MASDLNKTGFRIPANVGNTLAEIERYVIMETLKRVGGNKSKAAQLLGLWRPVLYGKLDRYAIRCAKRKR